MSAAHRIVSVHRLRVATCSNGTAFRCSWSRSGKRYRWCQHHSWIGSGRRYHGFRRSHRFSKLLIIVCERRGLRDCVWVLTMSVDHLLGVITVIIISSPSEEEGRRKRNRLQGRCGHGVHCLVEDHSLRADLCTSVKQDTVDP